MVAIPFAFKWMETLLLICSLQEEVSSIKESFATLEVASKELRNSRLFLKLLEAVLNTGNSMNDGAQAFKLDTSETLRSHRLKENQSTTSVQTEDSVEDNAQESADYHRNLGLQEITCILEEEKKKMSLIKSTGDYFHGNSGKDEGLCLFSVVSDFLIMLDKECTVVRNSKKIPVNTPRKGALTSPSQESCPESLPDICKQLFPAIQVSEYFGANMAWIIVY
ncbi:hypothetical protein KY284_030905 [Solanum tuberosum]|nr:hypothetical protein KY284_030905 [Solanum tuberosum]